MIRPDSLLAGINGPADLKALKPEQLPELADDVSALIKSVVEETGGHYSSPLGVVDLTLALHYVFDSPKDKLVWDVGHQAYAHKIITGRRDSFATLRSRDGISGFLKRSESEHDLFGAGHASTAISAALGMAEAHYLDGNDAHVVAIIGDGALTGGLAYEGLNNLGFTKRKMTVVVNDNRMSISPSVGSLSRYLTRISTNPLYNRIRDMLWDVTGKLPIGKSTFRHLFKKMEEGLKSLLTPGMLFEELGMRYFGPVDGHDYDAMLNVLKTVKGLPYPTVVHVLTKKGRGVAAAEEDSLQYYSLAGKKNEKPKGKVAPGYSKVFGHVAVELAEQNDKICTVTAAMEVGTGLALFNEKFPGRLFDVGIAEGHAVTFAAGLATQGRIPMVALYSTFSQRAFDQMMHDVSLQSLPVIICLDRAGVVGPDGPTHHGVFDMALFSMLPGVTVAAPKDGNELRDLMFSAVSYGRPVVIRYPKASSLRFSPKAKATMIPAGSWEILRDGHDLAILAVGTMVPEALEAAGELSEKFALEAKVINARFVKPLDRAMMGDLLDEQLPLLSVEEGSLAGGFGSALSQYSASLGYQPQIMSLGIGDAYVEHATRRELLESIGLTAAHIVTQAQTLVAQPVPDAV
jgi:1-deoxy-D-xylulose-5-phosphate synthase